MANFLFITTPKANGGSELLWLEAASRALEQGNRVTVLCHHDTEIWPELDQLIQNGATLVARSATPRRTFVRRILWRLSGNLKPYLQWWFKKFPQLPDVICVNQGGSYCASNMSGLIQWLNSCDAPFVVICHSHRTYAFPPAIYRKELQQCFSKANKVCFVAQENLKAAERCLGMKLKNAVVVQNPVNLPEAGRIAPIDRSFQIGDSGAEAAARDGDPHGSGGGRGRSRFLQAGARMACVARFDIRDKGQDLLLEALADNVWRQRDFRLNFYGSGPDRVVLEDLIKFYDLVDKVRIVGFESDIRKIWMEHSLLVLPSLSEGTPISLIEAQLCGRAALVTRVDGNPEWVEEGNTGFLAEAPTVHHLRLALERAWENRHRWAEMGEAARAACLAKRDPDPAGTLLALLRKAAERD